MLVQIKFYPRKQQKMLELNISFGLQKNYCVRIIIDTGKLMPSASVTPGKFLPKEATENVRTCI